MKGPGRIIDSGLVRRSRYILWDLEYRVLGLGISIYLSYRGGGRRLVYISSDCEADFPTM